MLRILFIEDSKDDYELACIELKKSLDNFSCTRVETKEEFHKEFPNVDIVIADCSLPNFDCEEALAVWRARGERIPFLILSGTISQEKGIILQNLGATDFVLKSNLIKLGISVIRALKEFQTKEKAKVIAIDGRVIHKINNMLTVIIGNASCLLASNLSISDRDALTKIKFAGREISGVMNNLGK